jgi:hypothetical protein
MRWKIIIRKALIVFVSGFLVSPEASVFGQLSFSENQSKTITVSDQVLAQVPILLQVVQEKKAHQFIRKIIPSDKAYLTEVQDEIIALIQAISKAPGYFASFSRLKTIFAQKSVEILGLSAQQAKQAANRIFTEQNIRSLKKELMICIDQYAIKDKFAPNRITITKRDVLHVYQFRDFSGQSLSKDEVREILSQTDIPSSVACLEGINQKAMVSPIALTDKGKTLLVKRGVDPSEIKPVHLLRPIPRGAIARAARMHAQKIVRQMPHVAVGAHKVKVFNFSSRNMDLPWLKKYMKSAGAPQGIRRIEMVPPAKLGARACRVTDRGRTVWLPSQKNRAAAEGFDCGNAQSRREIADEAGRAVQRLAVDEAMLTIPAMISGLDLREVFHSLVSELIDTKYSAKLIEHAEAIAVAVIRSTSQPDNYVSMQRFQDALVRQGIATPVAEAVARKPVVDAVASIIYEIREEVLALSGKEVFIYIDNRKVPLLTVGSDANYTPRQISLAQSRLIKEREILSQVEEIIVVDTMDRGTGYTLRKEGRVKAYVSQVFFQDDVRIPALNWMPTLEDESRFPEVTINHTVVSTRHPHIKLVLVYNKHINQTIHDIAVAGDRVTFMYTPEQGLLKKTKAETVKVEGVQALKELVTDEHMAIVLSDAPSTPFDKGLIRWLYGEDFLQRMIALEQSGRFQGAQGGIEYDFSVVATEFIPPLHRPIIEQNVKIIQNDLLKEHELDIDGVRVVPSEDFSIGRMDIRLRKMPTDEEAQKQRIHKKVVLEIGEDLAIALMNGDVSVTHLKRILRGGKIRLAPEDRRKWDRQRKLYQARIKEGARMDFLKSESIDKNSSKKERMLIASLNKAFSDSKGWIQKKIEGKKSYKDYIINETLDIVYEDIFDQYEEERKKDTIKMATLLKVYRDLQAQNALIFRKD